MNTTTQPDCQSLQTLDDFSDYVSQLRKETNLSQPLLQKCSKEICTAVWGEGNPDISGIGNTYAYVLEVAFGFCLASLVCMLNQGRPHFLGDSKRRALQSIANAGFCAFFDCALYFALAVELASIVFLVRKDFGISTAGFGVWDAQIALANSVLCILPLLHPVGILDEVAAHYPHPGGGERYKTQHLLFLLLSTLFFYPFICQCIRNWGLRQTELVSSSEMLEIQAVCSGGIPEFSDMAVWIVAITELMASLVIYLFMTWRIVKAARSKLILRQGEVDTTTPRRFTGGRIFRSLLIKVTLLLVPFLLSLPLLWAIFRLRRIHEEVAERTGRGYVANEWGFGQIVGMVIFAPVIVEMVFAGWK